MVILSDALDFSPDAVMRAHARRQMADAAAVSLVGGGEGMIDPLARLMDDEWREAVWEHPDTGIVLPGMLHPKQTEALEAASDFRHRWLFWGNQVGKTTLGAIDVALLALGRHPHQRWEPPLTIWASALTWDLWEQILLPELLAWLPAHRVVDAPPPGVKSLKRTIRVRADNGSITQIVGKSAEQGAAKYQSARVHHVWLDEEHPEAVWNEIQPRLLRSGGTTLATMTPLLGLTWVHRTIYEPWQRKESTAHWVSHAGLADNPSISDADIAHMRHVLRGNPVQLRARLYGEFARAEGLALQDIDPAKQSISDDAIAQGIDKQGWRLYAGLDFGHWRFAFVLVAVDRSGRIIVVEEMFDQRSVFDVRASKINEVIRRFVGSADVRVEMRGDAANPTDIQELNEAFRRGGMPWRVSAVAQENKARATSVEKLNNHIATKKMVFRRELGASSSWRLGMTTQNEGQQVVGSRLYYEIGAWSYPAPKEGKIQKQDPDDGTADGADMIAALRYVLMSIIRPAAFDAVGPEEKLKRLGVTESDYDLAADRALRRRGRVSRGF